MKSPVLSIFVLICMSFAYAQSGNTRFIDSPSWVLANDAQTSGRPSVGSSDQPNRADNPAKNQTVTEAKASRSQAENRPERRAEEAQGKKKSVEPSNPKKEGFLHIGVYVTPVLNWLGSIDKPYTRSGVTGCVTPMVMLDMRMVGRLYLGVGVAFNTFGGRVRNPSLGNVKYETAYSFSYVEIPVRVKWQTRNFADSKGSLFLSAGLNLGFGVSYKYKDIYDGPITINGSTMDGVFKFKDKMKKDSRLANLAGVAQFGYNYQIARRVNLIMGVEYHYGFVRPVKKNHSLGKPSYNNQQIGLLLGVMF
ncbi:MAG: PorT family protein [Bacteroides sp.]|nr:PorT family protein [Ruminococcus flavefaciens]MCM1555567.1 PorT family protein [Bacteroides sp.]